MKVSNDFLIDQFEPPSDFTRQTELFPGTWVDDGSADGLYGKKYPAPYMVRLLEEIQRKADRRHAAARVLTFDKELNKNPPLFNESLSKIWQARHKGRLPGMDWIDEMPPGTPFFAGICDRPRAPFWWLPWLSLERRAFLDPDFRYEYERGDWDD